MLAAIGDPPEWGAINTTRTDFSNDCGATGWSSFTKKHCRYLAFGNIVVVWFHFAGTGNDGTATGTYFDLPFPSKATVTGEMASSFMISVKDNGVDLLHPGQAFLSQNSSRVYLYADNTGALAWTASGAKYAMGFVIYEKA